MPRILLVLPTYLPESFGGAEQQARKLASTLAARGEDIDILTPRIHRQTPRHERDGRIEIHRLWQPHLPNLGGRYILSFLAWTLKSAFWIWRRRNRYDVVHIVHGRLHAVGPLIGARLAGRPSLVKIGRGGDHFDLRVVRSKTLIGLPCAWLVKRLASGFIANSQEIAGDFDTHGVSRAKVHRIPNGVVMPGASHGATAALRQTRNFIYLGRLDIEKALDRMIAGFAQLPENAAARLVLVGEGDCGDALKAQASHLGIADRVEFPGRVDDVAPFLQMADFYVSTSLSEGMSNALLEAMSHAVPPLVSRVSGVGDMVEDGVSGLLFEAGDDRAYAAKLAEALAMPEDKRLEMGRAAAETVRARFGMDHIAERHLALYAQLMEDGR